MKTTEANKKEARALPGGARWRYALLAEDLDADGLHCESYGVEITDVLTGEETRVRHITVNAAAAQALLDAVTRLAVSPVTLADVVEDYLASI